MQINLLKLMEETEVNLQSQNDIAGQIQALMDFQRRAGPRKRTINTRHILFIVSGAFDKLADQVKRRVQSSQIGFAAAGRERAGDDSDLLNLAQSRDFIEYGMEPEFVGRLPVRVACQTLTPGDLEKILLTSEGSILQQYRADFSGYGIDFEITLDAVREIATQAHAEHTGARGLMTVLERVLRDFKFELPVDGGEVLQDRPRDRRRASGTLQLPAETECRPAARRAQGRRRRVCRAVSEGSRFRARLR